MHFPNNLRYFSADEFKYPDKISHDLLYLLDDIRSIARVPIYVTSDYRPTVNTSSHHLGLAVDISDNLEGREPTSRWRIRVLRAALSRNVARIGIYDRHIHIDISETHDQDVAWWGSSE